MILKADQFDRMVKKPDPKIGALLIFGPDEGLVRERADAIARAVVDDLKDPFRVVELTGAAIKADPARLYDEAAALSMMGGRRVVRVRDVTDAGGEAMAEFLERQGDGALVVVEAGDLAKRSALRRAFEESDRGAAVACYLDDPMQVKRVVAEGLKAANVSIGPEALEVATQRLGEDRAQSRGEIEKLALYVGSGNTATVDDVLASIGDGGVMTVDDIVMAAFDGDQAALDRATARAWTEGTSPVQVLRAVLRHVERLIAVNAAVAKGTPLKMAMDRLRPPVFFKIADRFRRQLGAWSDADLAAALDLALLAEIDCKSTGMPAEAVCARALMRIAQAARRRARN